ncbi:MAG: hypothetical protein M3083_21795, partial [Actinomycetota bacterium]|nr:hypothetical protein [Actinomycetota bacterium]
MFGKRQQTCHLAHDLNPIFRSFNCAELFGVVNDLQFSGLVPAHLHRSHPAFDSRDRQSHRVPHRVSERFDTNLRCGG